jgi:hypothetical protein
VMKTTFPCLRYWVGQEKEMELKMVRECAIPPPFSFEKEVKSK